MPDKKKSENVLVDSLQFVYDNMRNMGMIYFSDYANSKLIWSSVNDNSTIVMPVNETDPSSIAFYKHCLHLLNLIKNLAKTVDVLSKRGNDKKDFLEIEIDRLNKFVDIKEIAVYVFDIRYRINTLSIMYEKVGGLNKRSEVLKQIQEWLERFSKVNITGENVLDFIKNIYSDQNNTVSDFSCLVEEYVSKDYRNNKNMIALKPIDLIDTDNWMCQFESMDNEGNSLLFENLKIICNIALQANEIIINYDNISYLSLGKQGLAILRLFKKIDWNVINSQELNRNCHKVINNMIANVVSSLSPYLKEIIQLSHQIEIDQHLRYGILSKEIRDAFYQIHAVCQERGILLSNPFVEYEKTQLPLLKAQKESIALDLTNANNNKISKIVNETSLLLKQYLALGSLISDADKASLAYVSACLISTTKLNSIPTYAYHIPFVGYLADQVTNTGITIVTSIMQEGMCAIEWVKKCLSHFDREKLLINLFAIKNEYNLSSLEGIDYRLIAELTEDQRKKMLRETHNEYPALAGKLRAEGEKRRIAASKWFFTRLVDKAFDTLGNYIVTPMFDSPDQLVNEIEQINKKIMEQNIQAIERGEAIKRCDDIIHKNIESNTHYAKILIRQKAMIDNQLIKLSNDRKISPDNMLLTNKIAILNDASIAWKIELDKCGDLPMSSITNPSKRNKYLIEKIFSPNNNKILNENKSWLATIRDALLSVLTLVVIPLVVYGFFHVINQVSSDHVEREQTPTAMIHPAIK